MAADGAGGTACRAERAHRIAATNEPDLIGDQPVVPRGAVAGTSRMTNEVDSAGAERTQLPERQPAGRSSETGATTPGLQPSGAARTSPWSGPPESINPVPM